MRTIFVLVAFLVTAGSGLAQSFQVSFPKERSAKPLDGRLYLLLSTDPTAEPRMQISGGVDTQLIFGMDLTPLVVDESADIAKYVAGQVENFLADVKSRLNRRLGT